MGLDNPIHIAFLLVILLLVFGAKRLPEMGRSLGSGLRGFKDTLTGEHVPEQVEAAPVASPMTAERVAVPVAAPMAAERTPEPAAERPRSVTAA